MNRYDLFVVLTISPRARAQNINTVDEVPDSSWFTNRIGMTTVTQQLALGDCRRTPTSEMGVGKRRHVHPGFTARDGKGETGSSS